MLRRVVGMMLVLGVVTFGIAQDPDKASKSKPPAKDAPKAGPGAEGIVDEILRRMDKDKDGRISKSEAQNRIAENFDRMDSNKDGYVDRKEVLEMVRRMQPTQGMRGPMFPGGPGFGRPDPNDFDALDKNADGRLTPAELRGTRFADLFKEIDTSKDGKIDPKEWEAYHARRRASATDK